MYSFNSLFQQQLYAQSNFVEGLMLQYPLTGKPYAPRTSQRKEFVNQMLPYNCSQNFPPQTLPHNSLPFATCNLLPNFSSFPSDQGPVESLPILPFKLEKFSSATEIISVKETGKKRPIYRRNIFKSILRNLRKYAKKNHKSIVERLREEGYSEQGISDAFFIINNYKKVEEQRGGRQKYRKLLNSIAKEKSIITLILKDSLKHKLTKLDSGNHGRIASQNYKVYRKTYTDFYGSILTTLEGNRIDSRGKPMDKETDKSCA
eukprot:TRINITY_DN1967_c0_g1_i10.p1 TRINITY_DN1967_c0_g1~~TRINITY_DN1967_c0_g1_i10.p1  ORF type:complete len:261 (-),score=7.05 TRINITY_DN1967_c0_g1_i10:241-1023(-)